MMAPNETGSDFINHILEAKMKHSAWYPDIQYDLHLDSMHWAMKCQWICLTT